MEKTFQDKTNLYRKIEEALSKKDVIVLTKSEKTKLERLAKKHKVSFDSLNNEFENGVKVEKEHMKNIKETKKIALDHLSEDPKYYTKLKKAKLEENIEILLKENEQNILGNLITAKVNFPDADFWIVRRGSEEKVGMPVKEFNPEHIGIKVDALDKLDSKYLYYVMLHIFNTKYFRDKAVGTLKLKNIRISDILNIPIGMNESLNEETLPKKLKTDIEIEYHKNLNPQFWLNNHLKSNIRKNLLNLAKFYFKQLDLGVELKDIIFTGSLANYNYTNLSDIDLHLVIDYKELTDDEDFAKEFFGDKRAIWADSNQIEIYGYPVEIYVQDKNQLDESYKGMGAMYSLLKNKWIKKPKYKLPDVDKHLITQKVNKYLDILNKISIMKDSIKKVDSYNKVFEKIRDDRRKATKEEGEFSIDNLVFKVLRNKKVFDVVRNNKKEIVNNVFSINSN
jgi:predicted nucleotidyltransferase